MNVQLNPNMGHCNLKIVFVAVDAFLGLFFFRRGGRQESFLDAHHLRTAFLCQHELFYIFCNDYGNEWNEKK